MTPLEKQFRSLAASRPGTSKEPVGNGSILIVLIVIPKVPLPPGWTATETTVRFLAPAGYPAARPDCFWADPDLALAGGRTPQASNLTPIPGEGRPYRWFSWHLANWNPVKDTLETYLHVCEDRLRKAL
jgi:hypothetical protein